MPYPSPYILVEEPPPDVELHRDPVTDAVLRRNRRNAFDVPVDSNSRGNVITPRCTIPDCRFSGQPHTMCRRLIRNARRCWFPCRAFRRNTRRNGYLEVYDPNEEEYHGAMGYVENQLQEPILCPPDVPAYPVEQIPLGGWLPATPHWPPPMTPCVPRHVRQSLTPRTMPVMMPATMPSPYHQPARHIQVPEVRAFNRWNEERLGSSGIPPVMPAYWAPPPNFGLHQIRRQHAPLPGAAPWRPQSWIAHPAPHPMIPVPEFWGMSNPADPFIAAQQQACRPWGDPSGTTWTPGPVPPHMMYALTGGHPLPGTDPLWTPAVWNPHPINQHNGVQLAPFLIPNPRNSCAPQILWDAVQHPSTIKRLTRSGNIVEFFTTSTWKDPATFPPTKEIHVVIPGMEEDWGNAVIKKNRDITVGNIFDAVYEYLQTPLTVAEAQGILSFPGGDEKMRRVEYACWRRCQVTPALPGFERTQGMKRVDMLEGSTVYWGMWPNYSPDGRWVLVLGFLPAHVSEYI